MTLDNFIVAYGNILEDYGDWHDTDELKNIFISKWSTDGKYESRYSIVTDGGNCFKIVDTRTGSYYTEYFYLVPHITQVLKRTELIETTFWDEII